MPTVQQLVPDVDVLLALSPEELGGVLLKVAKSKLQNGMVHLNIDGSVRCRVPNRCN